MIFQPDLARAVKNAQKTQTRRPVQPGKPCRYKPGKTYAVQPGRGQAATCRIHITHVHQETAGDITYPDARAEGFPTTDHFKTYWVSIHDRAWLQHEHAMLDEAEHEDGTVLDRDTWITRRSLDMFHQRHAHKPVWVITFHLDLDTPRYLAAQSDELYVTNPARALPNEPEAVDHDTQTRITARAGTITTQWQTIEQARRDRDRNLLSRKDQLARLNRAARLRSVDIRNELRLLERMRPTATEDAFTRKIQKTEARVFRAAA